MIKIWKLVILVWRASNLVPIEEWTGELIFTLCLTQHQLQVRDEN